MVKQILLSISILVSGRESTADKCIASLDRLRRRVPCELILVDTGCSEELRQWIKQKADKVIAFQWCNDFSAARNAGLQEASGEWFMFLDDDEWFEDTSRLEAFFLSGEYRGYASASYRIRNYMDMQGERWQDVSLPRMVRRNRDTRFVYPVHEMLWPRYEPEKYLEDFVHHYGYASASPEMNKEKHRRNLSLLLPAIEEDRYCMHHYLQAVMEYIAIEDLASALQTAEDGIRHYDSGRENDNSFYFGLCAAAVKIRVLDGQYGEAAGKGKDLLEHIELSRLARASVYGDLAIAWSALTGQCAMEAGGRKALEAGVQQMPEAKEQEGVEAGGRKTWEADGQQMWEAKKQEGVEDKYQETVGVSVLEEAEVKYQEAAAYLGRYLQEKEYYSAHTKELTAQQTLILDQCFEMYHYQMILGWGFAAALCSRKAVEAEALLQREPIAWWMEAVQNWYTSASERFREAWRENFQALAAEDGRQNRKMMQLYHVLTAPAPEAAEEIRVQEGNLPKEDVGQTVCGQEGKSANVPGQSADERQAARAEMEVLAEKLKVQIRLLIEQHQEQAALAAVRQVLQFLPEDEELQELLEKLEEGQKR